jgi:hypothetical protein
VIDDRARRSDAFSNEMEMRVAHDVSRDQQNGSGERLSDVRIVTDLFLVLEQSSDQFFNGHTCNFTRMSSLHVGNHREPADDLGVVADGVVFDHVEPGSLSSPAAAANPVRFSSTPLSPNDLINAGGDRRYHYALWNAKVHAVVPGPLHLQLSPFVRVLAEPLGTQTQDVVAIVDARVERTWGSGSSVLRPSSVIPPRIVRVGVKVDR